MGNKSSAAKREAQIQDRNASRQIDQQMESDMREQETALTLLLLGAGESGKSTVVKELTCLFGKGYSKAERMTYRDRVHTNALEAMQTLVVESEKLGEFHPECVVEGLEEERAMLKESCWDSMSGPNYTKTHGFMTPELGAAIGKLWQDKGIRATYELRSQFQLIDSAAYFFDRIDDLASEGYVASDHDIVRARVRTTGIVESEFAIDTNHFRIVDVGGQRNERKKWIHCFSDVTSVLYVMALHAYDLTLFEDNFTNRLTESLVLFREVCSYRWFMDTPIILFLNKDDLFREKIKRVPITVWIEHDRNQPPSHQLMPEEVAPPDDPNDYDSVMLFIMQLFRSLTGKHRAEIFPHVTTATDPENINHVFHDIKHIIIEQNLNELNL